ncbi:Hypothetical Protein FCC1311_019522 [Hondaea fermentalgiana]|uniref:Uncharacterized protein n=1 Tax=Hondaea fermentalgiana TaxID=2315210 RepID=A0A2R5GB02_9STRA|nr:Hypothetical Protein FCC1311_019522 [Hondaea fermentalgiana]|eukprot:GBG25733.1 Hypothetical Protein FCC1311_019522 [Hondaea fermentalgiana]
MSGSETSSGSGSESECSQGAGPMASVGDAARVGVQKLVAQLLRQGEEAGVERDEDEWLDAVAEACKLERANRALRQRIEEDYFGGTVFDAGLRPWALRDLRVRKRVAEQCGSEDYHDFEVTGLGPHRGTLRAVFRQNCATREASFRIAIFSDVDPVTEILRLKTKWACETHGFEEAEFDSFEQMHCGQCEDKKHACELELQPPGLLIEWFRAAGAHLEDADDVVAFLVVFTLLDLDEVASKLANFLFSPTAEHEEEYGSASEASRSPGSNKGGDDMEDEDADADDDENQGRASPSDADDDEKHEAKRRKTES